MLSQNMLLNKILTTKDMSVVTLNNLSADHFFNYRTEFLFIYNHFNAYRVVPDITTFISTFPDFELQEVKEPDSYLLEQVLSDYKKKWLAEGFNTIKKELESNNLDKAYSVFTQMQETTPRGAVVKSVDILHDTSSRYDEYVNRTNNFNNYYITTGFEALNSAIGGWDIHEEFALIAARTNMGKSYLSTFMALAAAQQGLTVGYYSGEMSALKVAYRVDTMFGHVSNGSLIHGNANVNYEYQQHLKRIQQINGKFLVLTPNDIAGPADVPALEAFIAREHLDILFVDQVSLLEDARHAKVPFEKVANISKDLKNLQVKTQVPIIAVCQLNRTKNDDGTLDTTQIAMSDRLSQDATTIIFIDRDKQDNTLMSLNIGKCRDNAVGASVKYKVDFNQGYFTEIKENLTEEEAEELESSFAPIEEE